MSRLQARIPYGSGYPAGICPGDTDMAVPSNRASCMMVVPSGGGGRSPGPWTLWMANGSWAESQKQGQGFPGGAVVESPPANAGDTGSSPGLGGSHMPRSN